MLFIRLMLRRLASGVVGFLVLSFSSVGIAQPALPVADFGVHGVKRLVSIHLTYLHQNRVSSVDAVGAAWCDTMPPGNYSSNYMAQYLTDSGRWIDGSVVVYASTDEMPSPDTTIFTLLFFTEENGRAIRVFDTRTSQTLVNMQFESYPHSSNVRVVTTESPTPNLTFDLQQKCNGKTVLWSEDGQTWNALPTGSAGSYINVGNIWKVSSANPIFCEIEWFRGLSFYRKQYLIHSDHTVVEVQKLPPFILRKDFLDSVRNRRLIEKFRKDQPSTKPH